MFLYLLLFNPCPYSILPPVSSSDHKAILFSLPLKSISLHPPTLPRRVWLYDQANYQLGNDLLSSVPWESTLPFSDTESAWLIFKHIFLSIMHTSIPSKLVYPSPRFSVPWINDSLLSHIKFRNSLYRSAKRTGPLSLWSYYRYFRNQTLSLLRSLKSRFFQSLSVSPNSRSFWSAINKIRKKPVSVPTLLCNGISASTPQAKADVLNEYFSSCFNKSCTPLSAVATPSLSPVTPIPKSKSSSSSPSNFRPISLLPLISKVLERHVFNYMYDFCLSHKLLTDSQFGFRPGFSTETALLSILHSWHTSLDSNNSVCSVFYLTKAFDSVPHKPLFDCLSAIDLPTALLIWLNNYLFDCSQQVVVNGSTSSKSVPQGSILGPLLFIIYINDLTILPLSSSSKLILYVDDILLSSVISSPPSMSAVQSDIDLIFSWLSSRFLSINLNKTKYMIVSRKSASFSLSLTPLYVDHSRLELVNSVKYLGVIISSNLSWSAHIRSVCSKSRQLIGVIFRHFYRSSSPQSLLKMYIALVLPHLSYCSSTLHLVLLSPLSSKKFRSLLFVCAPITGLQTTSIFSPIFNSLPSPPI